MGKAVEHAKLGLGLGRLEAPLQIGHEQLPTSRSAFSALSLLVLISSSPSFPRLHLDVRDACAPLCAPPGGSRAPVPSRSL